MSSLQNSELITISRQEFEKMQRETRRLRQELKNSQANLDAVNTELDRLKTAEAEGRRVSESGSVSEETGALLQNLIDELIVTCKTVHVPRNAIRPKLANLDELYTDELDEHIRIARLLLQDINHELTAVYGRKTSNPPAKISQMFVEF